MSNSSNQAPSFTEHNRTNTPDGFIRPTAPRANLQHDWLAWHIASARKASLLRALSGFSNDPTPRHRTSTKYEYLAAPQH